MSNKSKQRGKSSAEKARPRQSQKRQPGRQHKMSPAPVIVPDGYRGSGKLEGKAALVTGGDSGIGQAAAVLFALEGADVAIVYLEEQHDAERTQQLIEEAGRKCTLIKGDIGRKAFCKRAVERTVKSLGRLDILVNNAGEQHPQHDIEDIDEKQLLATFRTNVFSMIYLTQAALPHLRKQQDSSIVNTTSITAYRGSPGLLDYSASKGAIVAFTRSLSQKLLEDGIRVNAVAPGPIWTPLIPATFDEEKVSRFGQDAPMGRAGQPAECGTCFVFLASSNASYMTGQVLHPNGGEIIGG
jgi:NAD(P)-dependent dehydrogenase (short-subunit alcohol dehydrogenase family)